MSGRGKHIQWMCCMDDRLRSGTGGNSENRHFPKI